MDSAKGHASVVDSELMNMFRAHPLGEFGKRNRMGMMGRIKPSNVPWLHRQTTFSYGSTKAACAGLAMVQCEVLVNPTLPISGDYVAMSGVVNASGVVARSA
jgi:hypothetical protein